jgi:hypothetical protein
MGTILTTDDEVLALAAKIKHRRALDAKRRAAYDKLGQLEDDLSTGTTKLRHLARVEFLTIGSSYRPDHQDHVTIELPVGDGPDIIEFLSEFLANNISEELA